MGMTDYSTLFLCFELHVLLLEIVLDGESHDATHHTSPAHNTTAGIVARFLRVWKHVRCIEVRHSGSHEVDDSKSRRTLGPGSRQGGAHPAHAQIVR